MHILKHGCGYWYWRSLRRAGWICEWTFWFIKGVEIENSIAEVTRIVTRPVSVASSRGPFIFEIPAYPENFTEAESFRNHGQMRIRKRDASTIKGIIAIENVSTVNNIFHSLWGEVVVTINDVAINHPTISWYGHKAYFENPLSYSKANLLQYRGFILIHVKSLVILEVWVAVHTQSH